MAGGGTAGHLQPALAIAEALVERGHRRGTIEFVGSARGQDRAALAGRGFPVTLLPGRGIVRRARAADLAGNAVALVGLGAAVVRGFGVVARSRPRVVVSVGGYASVPAALAAVVTGVPLVVVNVDAVPGAANRLFGRFARACATGWEGTRPAPGGGDRHSGAPGHRRGRARSRRPAPGPRRARAPDRPGDGGGLRRIPRSPPPQPGGRRAGGPVEGPVRPGRLPHRRPTRLGAGLPRPIRARRAVGTRPSCGSPTRSAWARSTPPPTSWCAGPGP